MNCPRCSGPTWDNRDRKRDGEMKPNAPDFACKDKEGCGWIKWPAKGAQRAPTSEGPANGGGGKWTWVSLMATYRKSLLIAEQCLKQSQERNPKAVPFTHAEVLSAAATVFIAASRDGVREVPKPAPPPAPEDLPDELPEDDTDDY